MQNFEWYNPTRILFGRGTHNRAGELVKPFADKVLLHYGGGSAKRSGILDAVEASLNAQGIECVHLGGVQPNPRLEKVREGVRLCKKEQIPFVLAVGGGSVIDSAKAIAMGAVYDGDVWDFYSKEIACERALKIGVVLTIPAAGSESSNASVITNQAEALKNSCIADAVYPAFAILNPETCYTLSSGQIAAGGVDMLCHVMERYFSTEPHTDLTDRLCEGTMRTLLACLPQVISRPHDYDAWAEVMWAGAIAHNGLLGKGRAEAWTCHTIEHELSAQYDIAHGDGLAVLFPAWMKYVYQQALPRFAQFASRVMGVDYALDQQEAAALEGINRLEGFFAQIGAPTHLSQLGIGPERFEAMAQRLFGPWGPWGAIRPLSIDAMVRVFTSAL